MELWTPHHIDRIGDKTHVFVEESDDLLVLNVKDPCIMVFPPHCFHAVFTIKTALHIGTRAVSTLWYDQMETVIETWSLEKNRRFVRDDVSLSGMLWLEFYQDMCLECFGWNSTRTCVCGFHG
jgi:hypothetical protein